MRYSILRCVPRLRTARGCSNEGTMAFEFWRYITHGEVTATRDVLALVVLQIGSSSLSELAFLGELAYLLEFLLGLAGALLGLVGVLRCFGRNALCSDNTPIDEKRKLSSDERKAPVEEPSERNSEVTVRLDERHLWLLRRRRCIVTFHTSVGDAHNAEQEVWYAKNEKSNS